MGTFFSGLSKTEGTLQQFFGRSGAVEGGIGLLDFGLFLFAEPTACAMLQFQFQLGIKLVIFNRRGAVDGVFHLHTDEATATAAVGQQVATVVPYK